MRRRFRDEEEDIQERVVRVDRTRKTVKGGRISSARVVCAVGDGKGMVGVGVGKARDVPRAIEKGMQHARKQMIRVPLDGYTIPHMIEGKAGGAIILLRPASRGTGIVAGGAVRQIVEVSGIRDILTKSLGSGNVFNRAMACFSGLKSLYDPHEVAARREKTVQELLGREVIDPYKQAEEEAAAAAEAAEAAKAEAKANAEQSAFEQALVETDGEAPAEEAAAPEAPVAEEAPAEETPAEQ